MLAAYHSDSLEWSHRVTFEGCYDLSAMPCFCVFESEKSRHSQLYASRCPLLLNRLISHTLIMVDGNICFAHLQKIGSSGVARYANKQTNKLIDHTQQLGRQTRNLRQGHRGWGFFLALDMGIWRLIFLTLQRITL